MNRVTISFILLLLSCGGGGGSPPPAASMVTVPSAAPPPAAASPSPQSPAISPALRALHECAEGKSDDEANRATGDAIAEARTQIVEQRGGAPDTKALTNAVWSCFAAFQPSKAKRISLIRSIHEAIFEIKDPSYGPKATQLIEKPITDPRDPIEGMNEIQFHQATAIRLLGDLKYTAAVRPLINVLLTPSKRDLVFPVRLALHKMAKDAEPLLVSALAGSDPDFAKLEAAYPNFGYVPILAEPLSAISRPKGREAVIDALTKAGDNDENRAMLAVILTQFPKTDASTKAFFAAYSKVKSGVSVTAMGGMNARAVIASAVGHFFDGAYVDFLLKEIATAKGDEKDALPPAAFPVAVKLMTNANSTAVGNAVKKLQGTAMEKDLYASAITVLDLCKKDVDCYLRFVANTPVPTTPPSSKMAHVKALWMIAMLTPESAATKMKASLIRVLAGIEDGSVSLAIVQALAHLSPKGDETTAKALEAIVETNSNAGRKAGVDEMYRTALTLRSRLD